VKLHKPAQLFQLHLLTNYIVNIDIYIQPHL